MQNIKIFLVWIFFGYSNRVFSTNLRYKKINLHYLGVDVEYSNFEFLKKNGFFERFKVLEIKGKIFMKPEIGEKVFYKLMVMYSIAGWIFNYFKGNGIILAILFCFIVNLLTWLNQLKNHQILRLKIDEVNDLVNLVSYLKNKRLKLAIERLNNFENRNISDYEFHLKKQDVDFIKNTLKDEEFLSDWDSKFVDNLMAFINKSDTKDEVYTELIDYLNDFLYYNFQNDLRSRSINIMKREADYTIQKELSFFEV